MNAEDRARVEDAISERRTLIDEAIDERLPIKRPERLYEASRYLLDAGGKRLRPTLVLLAGEAIEGVPLGAEPYDAFPAADGPVDLMAAAVSIEVIQSFTLIHDDIM
ncbi:MAG: polyprenyl synthetase family protein, partial [Haloarculaceae archaeon]